MMETNFLTTEKGLTYSPSDDKEDILFRLRPYMTYVVYKSGQQLDLPTDNNCLYFVEKGLVEVSYESKGTKIVVALIGKGEFFGEVGFIDGRTRVRKIKAREESHILCLTSTRFSKLRFKDPLLYGDTLKLISHSICKRFRQIASESKPLVSYSALLSAGRVPLFREVKPVPEKMFTSELWRRVSNKVEQFKGAMYKIANDAQILYGSQLFDACYPEVEALIDAFDRDLEQLAREQDTSGEVLDYIWGYIFKEIFPYFMRSRFAQRAYFKPKGYAGDFLMMEAIYRNKPEGEGNLGLLIDKYCLNTTPARAVRERRRLLAKLLEKEARARVENECKSTNKINIMNLACGSNRELFDFLKKFEATDLIEAICIDADKDALEYTSEKVDVFPHEAEIMLMQENVVKWAIGRSRHNFGKQDIIYSAGLTDYLDDRLFIALVKKARDYLKPGGVLILSNFSINNPNKAWMDHILQWKLIHRSKQDLERLFRAGGFGQSIEVFHEKEGVNLFAIGRKET